VRTDMFGWFDDVSSNPAHNPGLEAPCVVCAKKLSRPMKTISLMIDGDSKSYFYRTHKACWDGISEREQWLIESSVIDNIKDSK